MNLLREHTSTGGGSDRTATEHVDVCVIGSGFSGIAMAVRMLEDGMRDFVVLERGADIGGTWRDNAYPGCACDVPSHLYSLSFAPNPEWSATFSPQREIQDYLRRVARERGVLPHVRLNTALEEAEWDSGAQRWRVTTSAGELTARVLIAAPGGLSEPKLPDAPGIERFAGRIFHSAGWDHDHDVTGERVAVVGTGASAIQIVPAIQPRVSQLHLFQRTPAWVMPRRSRPITRVERFVYRRFPLAQRLMRAGIYWARELFALPMLHPLLARPARRVSLRFLERQVRDPELRRRLTPGYLPGCKRILVSDDYWPACTRANVEVLPTAVAEIRERSIVGADGSEREVDTIVLATGFHVSDMPLAEHIRDASGRTVAEVFAGSPRAYKGTAVAGFPNLFWILGPNTGLGHTSVVFMAEVQVGYVMGALRRMRREAIATLEVLPEAQEGWCRDIDRRMANTVWMRGGCSSWYLDENGRNSTLWPGQTFAFARALRRFDAEAYAATPAGAVAPVSQVPVAA
jgi:cation diffusion facilitator CzcD-associated flavoprotein CzcO